MQQIKTFERPLLIRYVAWVLRENEGCSPKLSDSSDNVFALHCAGRRWNGIAVNFPWHLLLLVALLYVALSVKTVKREKRIFKIFVSRASPPLPQFSRWNSETISEQATDAPSSAGRSASRKAATTPLRLVCKIFTVLAASTNR